LKFNLYPLFFLVLSLNFLEAYSLFGLPFTWIGAILLISISAILLRTLITKNQPLFLLVGSILMLMLALIFNMINWEHFSSIFPRGARTSYASYIMLRYLAFFTFLAAVSLLTCLCLAGRVYEVINGLVNVGIVVSIYALYVYMAQLYGWTELLPRNRVGTSGAEQATHFTYAFHRATGSFREPSHLVEWLFVPFVLAVGLSKNINWRVTLIGGVILLTGSMTGIISLATGFILTIIFYMINRANMRISYSNVRTIGFLLISISFTFIIINLFLNNLLVEVIQSRSDAILSGGLMATNRAYVYIFADTLPVIPMTGLGLGNLQIEHSAFYNGDLIMSVLNLYLNALHSFGAIGFIIFVGVLAYPLFKALLMPDRHPLIFFIIWGYLSWLIAFSVRSEELSVMFGVNYGLLYYLATQRKYLSIRPTS
jgi:hypothetical protein